MCTCVAQFVTDTKSQGNATNAANGSRQQTNENHTCNSQHMETMRSRAKQHGKAAKPSVMFISLLRRGSWPSHPPSACLPRMSGGYQPCGIDSCTKRGGVSAKTQENGAQTSCQLTSPYNACHRPQQTTKPGPHGSDDRSRDVPSKRYHTGHASANGQLAHKVRLQDVVGLDALHGSD
jgi:hypothetical protein